MTMTPDNEEKSSVGGTTWTVTVFLEEAYYPVNDQGRKGTYRRHTDVLARAPHRPGLASRCRGLPGRRGRLPPPAGGLPGPLPAALLPRRAARAGPGRLAGQAQQPP